MYEQRTILVPGDKTNKGGITLESILTSVKKLLGIEEEYEHFDPDIIMHINSVFLNLQQLGVGPSEGFAIEDANTTWEDYIGNDKKLGTVKSFMYLKVKLLFDPPTSSSAVESMKHMASEFEWRINVAVENAKLLEEEIQNGE